MQFYLTAHVTPSLGVHEPKELLLPARHPGRSAERANPSSKEHVGESFQVRRPLPLVEANGGVSRISPNVSSTPRRQTTLGTNTGMVCRVSRAPWPLRPQSLPQESISFNVRDCTEPNGRFSSVFRTRTLCSVETSPGQNRVAPSLWVVGPVTDMRALPQCHGILPAPRNSVMTSLRRFETHDFQKE